MANTVLLLSQFKYVGFLVESLNDLLAWVGLPYALSHPGVVWPIGFRASGMADLRG